MKDFGRLFKRYWWWVLPVWAASAYLGWRIGAALVIIEKLGEGM